MDAHLQIENVRWICITPCESMNQVQSFAVKQLLLLTSIFTGVVD